MSVNTEFAINEFKEHASLVRAFYATWRRLARLGACDALDTMECFRVYGEWISAGRPRRMVSFICSAANRPPILKE